MMKISTRSLFDSPHPLISEYEFPWEATEKLSENIIALGRTLGNDYYSPKENIWIHRTAKISESAEIVAPCIIESGAEIRHCAYIRGSVYVGANAVIGNSSEVKNSILSERACLPHFNYAGDSVIGRGAHLGAGAVISNLRLDKASVTVSDGNEKIATGMRKFGAAVGDGTEVGCGAVICPGSIIGKGCIIYPLALVRGCVDENSVYKSVDCVNERRL